MFSALNRNLIIGSIVLLGIGYILLGQGPVENPLSFSVAPVVLIITYLVIIPLSILLKEKEKK